MSTSESQSYVSGPLTPALWSKTLSHLIEEQAVRYGSHTAAAFPWQDVRLSYRDLWDHSETLAKAMLSCGLQHGDCVAIMAGNCFQYITAFLGAARIGCPYVVLNNTYSPQELTNALSLSGCKMLFLAESIGVKSLSKHFDRVEKDISNFPALKHVIMLSGQYQLNNTSREILVFDELLSRARTVDQMTLQAAERQVQPNDVLNLQFTSGTTGNPKAAMLTHNNLVNNGRLVGAKMRLTPDDVVACPPPLFHCFGLVMGFLASVAHGSSIVFPSDQFRADLALDAVYHEKCTALLGVPTMFVAMLETNKQKGYQINTVRTGLAAGSSVPAVLMRQLNAEFGIQGMLIAYGMTETSPVTFLTSLDDTEERKTTTVGQVMPHTAAKVVDRNGKIVPRGTPGELCTSGYALQKGYWQNQAKTDEVMKRDENGVLWMHTGDECVIDRSGYCMVTGRIKDIIIRGKSTLTWAWRRWLTRPQAEKTSSHRKSRNAFFSTQPFLKQAWSPSRTQSMEKSLALS